MIPVSRNMPSIDSSGADFRIVSPNARNPVLYRANLKIRATRASRINRITIIAPEIQTLHISIPPLQLSITI